ncbi:serine-rich adhesin for platelets-like, partial [Rhagoletis pomonella]|uniref:serine-rich adhesin for platelets-like n=1 Tax=Rhagoletis pomonella TaxID=28610 RepID=UPI001781E8CB
MHTPHLVTPSAPTAATASAAHHHTHHHQNNNYQHYAPHYQNNNSNSSYIPHDQSTTIFSKTNPTYHHTATNATTNANSNHTNNTNNTNNTSSSTPSAHKFAPARRLAARQTLRLQIPKQQGDSYALQNACNGGVGGAAASSTYYKHSPSQLPPAPILKRHTATPTQSLHASSSFPKSASPLESHKLPNVVCNSSSPSSQLSSASSLLYNGSNYSSSGLSIHPATATPTSGAHKFLNLRKPSITLNSADVRNGNTNNNGNSSSSIGSCGSDLFGFTRELSPSIDMSEHSPIFAELASSISPSTTSSGCSPTHHINRLFSLSPSTMRSYGNDARCLRRRFGMGNRMSSFWCKNSSLQLPDNSNSNNNKNNKTERGQSHNRSPSGFFKSSGNRRMSLNCVSRKSKSSGDTTATRSSTEEATTTLKTPINTATTPAAAAAKTIAALDELVDFTTATTNSTPARSKISTTASTSSLPALAAPTTTTTTTTTTAAKTSPNTPLTMTTILSSSSSRHEQASATTIRNISTTAATSKTTSRQQQRQAINMKTNTLPRSTTTTTTPTIVRTPPDGGQTGTPPSQTSPAATAAASKRTPTISTIEQEFAKLMKARTGTANSESRYGEEDSRDFKNKSTQQNHYTIKKNIGKGGGTERCSVNDLKALFLSAPQTAVNYASAASATKTMAEGIATKNLKSPVKVIITAADESTDTEGSTEYSKRANGNLPSKPINHVQPYMK